MFTACKQTDQAKSLQRVYCPLLTACKYMGMSKTPKNPPEARVTPLDAIVGKVVHDLRKQKKVTQDDLSEAMGISKGLLSQLESGNRAWNSTTLSAAADYFQIGVAELVGGATLSKEDKTDLELIRALRDAKGKAASTD